MDDTQGWSADRGVLVAAGQSDVFLGLVRAGGAAKMQAKYARRRSWRAGDEVPYCMVCTVAQVGPGARTPVDSWSYLQ